MLVIAVSGRVGYFFMFFWWLNILELLVEGNVVSEVE
ncbi:Uncharacterised protein [Chlamydia trachomatis]|nr:Uncharacterised protein [Chlamydia trachomatis]